jgi:hypothetical protein
MSPCVEDHCPPDWHPLDLPYAHVLNLSDFRFFMSTLAIRLDPHAVHVAIDDTALHFILADGREISAPLEWFPRLRDATVGQRQHWRLIGKGLGAHWPEIDEDIAVTTLMRNA